MSKGRLKDAWKSQRFIEAASDGDWGRVVSMIKGGNVNLDAGQGAVLRIASEQGRVPIIAMLLEKGADVHAQDDLALRRAAECGRIDSVQMLLKHGADVHAKNEEALYHAVRSSNAELVEVLVNAGANPANSEKVQALAGKYEKTVSALRKADDRKVVPLAEKQRKFG